jgi:hypothetical protein
MNIKYNQIKGIKISKKLGFFDYSNNCSDDTLNTWTGNSGIYSFCEILQITHKN